VGHVRKSVTEEMIREAEDQLLRGSLTEDAKWLIDAILSFMCVSIHRGKFLEQPNDYVHQSRTLDEPLIRTCKP